MVFGGVKAASVNAQHMLHFALIEIFDFYTLEHYYNITLHILGVRAEYFCQVRVWPNYCFYE